MLDTDSFENIEARVWGCNDEPRDFRVPVHLLNICQTLNKLTLQSGVYYTGWRGLELPTGLG